LTKDEVPLSRYDYLIFWPNLGPISAAEATELNKKYIYELYSLRNCPTNSLTQMLLDTELYLKTIK